MPEKLTADKLLDNLMVTLADNFPKTKNMSFFVEEQPKSVTSQFSRLFGRQKPVHHLLGGGKSADVLLWRDKKNSATVVTGATAIWTLFEFFDYHVLTLVCFALIFGMMAQFVWSNAKVLFNSHSRSSSRAPRFVLPDELFVNVARSVGAEVNHVLGFIQDVSCGGNLKQFLTVILSLWAAAVVGSWFDFLTVLYTGVLGAHTLPVLYEKYEEEVDGFIYKVIDSLRGHYRTVDSGILSKIPKGRKGKKQY